MARVLLLETIAQERGLMRMAILEDWVARMVAAGSADPAMEQGIALARQDLNQLVDDHFAKLPLLVAQAVAEDAGAVLRLDKYLKYAIKVRWGSATASAAARVATPYYLSYKVYRRIRDQEDRARIASLAATLQRKLFEAEGIVYYRDRILVPGAVDAQQVQRFAELYQMSWYLSARHYDETVDTLNNSLSRIYGAALDFFYGGAYSATIADLKRSLEYRRMLAARLTPTAYLAAVQSPFDARAQPSELAWLETLVRPYAVTGNTPLSSTSLGICVTLPWDPAGTPATLEGMNVRFEPRGCSDPDGSDPWECGANDPDGECTARAQLFWDDDRNPGNADCDNGHGPCPIAWAEELHPHRGTFFWRAADDGLAQGDYYLLARITDDNGEAEAYADGYYTFIDPLFEAGAWSVIAVDVAEGARGDGDGIPELGEEVSIDLWVRNDLSRSLDNVEIHELSLENDSVRNLVLEDWDPGVPENLELNAILDGHTPVGAAAPGQVVEASDDLQLFIGTGSATTVDVVAWIEYLDPGNPVDPQLRRQQEIGFSFDVSDGSAGPDLRCGHTDLVGDTDGDGVFESGERGYFTASLCNDGDWEARELWGHFEDPPPIGSWTDEDAPFPDLNPGECQHSDDDYALRTESWECGSLVLPLRAVYQGNTQTGLTCSLDVACVPWQSIQDSQEAGVVAQGDPVEVAISLYNPGAATLSISSVVELGGASDTTVTSFPVTLAPATGGTIEVTIDTSALAPGSYSRTLRVSSNANNPDERDSVIYFDVSGGAVAEQLTTTGVDSGCRHDLNGSRDVFIRGNDVYVIDVYSQVETRLTSTPEFEYDPRIDGDYVVFERHSGDPNLANVILHDLSTGLETQITDLIVHIRIIRISTLEIT